MPTRRALASVVVLTAFTLWGTVAGATVAPGGDEPPVTAAVEMLTVTIPAELHAQGLALPGRLFRPVGTTRATPTVFVLHGSGGLTKMPRSKRETCSPELEAQFTRWGERLAGQGYVVVMPSSYEPRGFCDMDDDASRVPRTFDTGPEINLSRIYDLEATSKWACRRAEVDCARLGLLGFSQGGTLTMLGLHWQLDRAVAKYRDERGDRVDFPIRDLDPRRPGFRTGVAYYPGCGFDSVVPLGTSTSTAIQDQFFAPSGLTILHGGRDDLIEHCSRSHGKGTRQVQSARVARDLCRADTYSLTVYDDAGHGFDSVGSSGRAADRRARDAALPVALARLGAALRS
ncbi:MAG: dienelactone hydrolase family protein [Acidimicrobiia bacterium]